MYQIFLSFLPWIILGTVIQGSINDYRGAFLIALGPIIMSFISGILVSSNKINKFYSLIIIIVISIWILIDMRADIGFLEYDGSLKLKAFIKIIKTCIILIPLTYFYLGYFLTTLVKFFIKK
ncbi:MAG: hypothetical protein ACRCXX_07015 [Cetobacterium sp.]|uniref:hypothetical protein n=1 Tax=Cetobacterium sp. TaxID=2071632 RepID=UPI003F350BEF